PAGATDTSRSCAVQSFQPVSRKSMESQGGSSGGDHAWETSFGESDLSDHRNASHCGNNPGPKTMTLFLKRGTKSTTSRQRGQRFLGHNGLTRTMPVAIL